MFHIRLTTGDPDRLYDIRHIPGKGLGFIALHDIPKGTHIMSEEPFIFFPKQRAEQIGWHSAVSHAIQQLPASRRDDFRSLHNQFVNDMLPDLGIFHTNCASVGKPPFALAVYAASSRLNHACSENSYLVWSSHDQKQTLISTHDIKAGEEITVSYLPEKLPREERRQILRDACKFDCECHACRGLGELVVGGDATNNDPRLFDLIAEDQKKFIFDGMVSTQQNNAAQVPSALSDLLRSATVKNHANPEISLPEQPDGIPVRFPFSPKLTPEHTALGLPSSFVPPALEIQVWLWNSDAAPLNNHRYNDFRDNYMFPPFQSLPSEENTDEDHFVLTPNGFRPRRNWVFFCEIVSFDVGSSYEEPDCVNVIVEDKTGHQSRVVFYTDSPAAEAKLAQLEVGYTLGILCPDRCQFSNGTVGTRQQCPRTMRVFRKDLYSMLLLSDKIQRSSPPPVGPSEKRCQICDRSRPVMVECEKCQMFWYCSTLCACIACAEDDHLTECYVMDRPDFQYFIRMNDEFRSWPDFTYD